MAKTHVARRTHDHEEIRHWVEEREGRPAIVQGTRERGNGGILRIDFDEAEESLEEISWDEFFRIFDDRGLLFLYQEETANGEQSRFCKFVRDDGGDQEEPEE